MSEAKPFCISKWEVWEAYKRVKANQRAAGGDEQSIADFERDLKGNLYKIWNRMSSGSYFPPPVRTVRIPKANGGERQLGIPTVSDRTDGSEVEIGAGGGPLSRSVKFPNSATRLQPKILGCNPDRLYPAFFALGIAMIFFRSSSAFLSNSSVRRAASWSCPGSRWR
jgi:hypothetical protein